MPRGDFFFDTMVEDSGKYSHSVHSYTPCRPISDIRLILTSSSDRHYDKDMLLSALNVAEKTYFDILATEWIAETQIQSSMSTITKHKAFLEILQMGKSALPLILRRMRDGDLHVHWFPALKRISGVDPVLFESRGKIAEMSLLAIRCG